VRLNAAGYPAEIVPTEYDQWPGGRIVYETRAQRFVLYAYRRLRKPGIIDALKAAFSLNQAEVIVSSDDSIAEHTGSHHAAERPVLAQMHRRAHRLGIAPFAAP
jgi:hypothetical protein